MELGKHQEQTKLHQIHQHHLSFWRTESLHISCWLDGQAMTDRHMKEGLKQKVSKAAVKRAEVCFPALQKTLGTSLLL